MAACPAGYSCIVLNGKQVRTPRVGHVPMHIDPGEFLHALPVGAFGKMLLPLALLAMVTAVGFVCTMWYRLRRGPG